VLEAGIDIDLTTLKLIGARGFVIALVGTFMPIAIAFGIANALGYTGLAAVAAGCTFAPTSLGIAMNVLRQSGIANTPVGQLIVAAAIIDDMVACKCFGFIVCRVLILIHSSLTVCIVILFSVIILSQLRAFSSEGDVSAMDIMLPVISALGFLIIGGSLALFVLPKALNWLILDRIPNDSHCSREWMSLAIMFVLLLTLIPATYYAKASPLLGAFLAGLVFCSDGHVHHMFVSQFKRVMQWLMRIFFAASIGFQVPVQAFASGTVIWQGLCFTAALLGKVMVGFLVPNFSLARYFRKAHLRDCLIVGFSMAAEGEFAFVIAVFAVVHNMITEELYASVVLAVLLSTILAPLSLRLTISYFNKKLQNEYFGESNQGDGYKDSLLEKSVREQTAVFYCIQTKSAPAWGLQTDIIRALDELNLDVIDHRSWHPRVAKELLVNEIYVRDAKELSPSLSELDRDKHICSRTVEIERTIAEVIEQDNAIIRAQRWIPEIVVADDSTTSSSDDGISEQIVRAASASFQRSQRRPSVAPVDTAAPIIAQDAAYVAMEEELMEKEVEHSNSQSPRGVHRTISHLDIRSKGRLEGMFRRDNKKKSSGDGRPVRAIASNDGIELLDSHGIGTGYCEEKEEYDVHGASIA
jgi:Kef-type K+ transport system membrane component KefB